MRVIFFLLFVLFFNFVLGQYKQRGIFVDNPFYGKNNYDKYCKKDKRVSYPTPFEKFPKKIPSFTDDTYSCRAPLGMSYFMLRGKIPPTILPSSGILEEEISLHRFYKLYKMKAYMFIETFGDINYMFEYYRVFTENYTFTGYKSYVDVKLHGLMIVDGLIMTGGNDFYYSGNIRHSASWFYATIRWSVNYTTDYKEWTQYRNKHGDVHQFSLLETTRKDGVAYPGYSKFDPRIIARGIRIIPLGYRLAYDVGPGLSFEVFGCSYDGENAGLQTPVANKKASYWLSKETILPWQLYGENTPTTKVSPEKQASMVLSRFYRGKEKDGMSKGFGHCQQVSSKNPVRLNLVQKGEYWFPKGSPLKYILHGNNDYISRCISDDEYRMTPAVCITCFNSLEIWRKSWGMIKSQSLKPLSSRYYSARHDKERNELETVVRKKPKRGHYWCAQRFTGTKFSFKPYPIRRTADCNDVLMEFGQPFCKKPATLYWELDFKKIHLVNSLKFKGHTEAVRNSWVSHVIVVYSTDRHTWLPIKSRYLENWHFPANTGPRHTSHHPLNPRVRARYLRIFPHKGKNDLCMRVEVRGCAKEPWFEAQQKFKDDAKRIGFNMWHVVVSEKNKGKTMQIKCFPDDAKVRGTETLYEIHGSYKFLLRNNKLKLEEHDEAKFYKCEGRDHMDRIISTQLYIITTQGRPGLLLPVQEQGLLHEGGMPVLDYYGTIWAYEPVAAKLTFLFFPDKIYSYEWYGFVDRKWALEYFYVQELGKSVNKKDCFQLALHANHRYFIFIGKKCFTSWALPYFVDAREKFDHYSDDAREYVYVIHQSRKPYDVYWTKGKEGLGTYTVEKKAFVDQPVLQLLPYSVGKFRFRFNSFITTHGYDSHSLIIKDFTVNEVEDYAINIKEEKGRKILFSRSVVLRHFGEPRFNMSATGGACLNHPLTVTAIPLRGEYVEVAEWDVEWRKIENGKALKTNMETHDPFLLKAERATASHSGVYRIRAKNRYGFAEGVIRINVVERVPSITSVTSSPHVAVEDSSDILHVDVKNEEDLVSINWYYNGKLIEIEDKHYSFPGALPGRPDSRKILKMSNMHLGMSGVYKVITKAKFCEFTKEIVVDVYVRPKMIVIPNVRTMYQIAGGNTTIVKVIIAGGVPMPQREHLVWYKGSKALQATRNGRVKIQNDEWLEKKDNSKDIIQSKRKRIGWNSTLSITSPRVSDSGKYYFMVSFPNTNYTVERTIKVTKL